MPKTYRERCVQCDQYKELPIIDLARVDSPRKQTSRFVSKICDECKADNIRFTERQKKKVDSGF